MMRMSSATLQHYAQQQEFWAIQIIYQLFVGKMFSQKYPEFIKGGVSWQYLTKLIQLCNSFEKKRKGKGLKFTGKRSKANLIKGTVSGRIDLNSLSISPGMNVCVFYSYIWAYVVLHVIDQSDVVVFYSLNTNPISYDKSDL